MKRRVPAVSLQNPRARPTPRFDRRARSASCSSDLGTPDATTYWAMRRYLKEFLSDRRVIEVNRVLWWFILNGVVLVKRPFASGTRYRLDLERGARQIAALHHHAAPGQKVSVALSSQKHIVVALGDALRKPEHRIPRRSAGLPRLRPIDCLPALSAIRRSEHGRLPTTRCSMP